MKKRQGSATTVLVALLVLILLAASAYLGIAAIAARKTAQGESFLRNEEYAGALASFKDAERFDSYILRKNPHVIEGIAESYFGLEDYTLALEYYLRVTAADLFNAKAVFNIGRIHIKEKNYDQVGEQIKTLEGMKTYEANEYARMLSELLRENSLKGVLKDLYDRFAPNLPEFPGLGDRLDSLKDKLTPDSDEEKEDREPEKRVPDTSETENKKGNGAGAAI